jgi:hypothetical protein
MAPTTPPPATPAPIRNRPALSKIGYRIGTYTSFRRSMLEAIARHVRRPDGDTSAASAERPLEPWTSRTADDYGIAFLEMWAYLADVLTFYQERIANEAYLRTAVQPRSVAALVSIIGYHPSPGRAATGHLAFEVEDGATVRIDAGLLVQSVPGQDEAPQKFETTEQVEGHAALNTLLPRTQKPQTLQYGSRRAVTDGIGHAVAPGDWVAIVGDERRKDPTSERWDLRQVVAVDEAADRQTTTITWEGGLGWGPRWGRPRVLPAADPELWVFRGSAAPFGHNAPDWRLIAASEGHLAAAFPDWSDKHLPEDKAQAQYLYLDTVHPGIVAGQWVALVAAEVASRQRYERYIELYPIQGVAETTHVNYTLSAKVTRLRLDLDPTGQPENIDRFGMRSTTVLIRSERLPLADVPLGQSSITADHDEPEPVAGQVIELEGTHPDIHLGRKLVVTGQRVDGAGEHAEAVEVADVEHDQRTTIRLATPLAHAYDRASVRIRGNVATATHGETVAGEILGDGEASRRFQSFALRRQPVTYVPQGGAPGGVASTVEVRVEGVRWDEVPELHDAAPDARVYVARSQTDGSAAIQFGDGETGARLVSGRGNVEATYRVGLGPTGNVGRDAIRTLLARPLGLGSVTNPAPTSGGASAEDPASVRSTAPGTVRTFGRIVSLHDFEDAAREYVGIAKARASWLWDGEQRVIDLVVAADRGAPAGTLLDDLDDDLAARRDRYQPLRLREFTPMPVSVAIEVIVDRAYLIEPVQDAATMALRELFAFDALDLGETVHLSDVYRAVQQVDGVTAVRVEEFRFLRPEDRDRRGDDDPVEPRLLIAPHELAWVDDRDHVVVRHARHERGRPS